MAIRADVQEPVKLIMALPVQSTRPPEDQFACRFVETISQ